MDQLLKLPLCPRCCDTRHVIELDTLTLLIVRDSYPWYECLVCGIRWNAREGIREADWRPCFS